MTAGWSEGLSDTSQRPLRDKRLQGSVIIPAFNEERVIGNCLAALGPAAEAGLLEVLVICNGCVDDTAAIARTFSGVKVGELAQGSKPAALNLGDQLATAWPRLYVDADVVMSADSALALLAELRKEHVMAARPRGQTESNHASGPVRMYYRARHRIFGGLPVMWYSSVYGLSRDGHERIRPFPEIVADDLYVDSSFRESEKTIAWGATSIQRAPADLKSLLGILRRQHRGTSDLVGQRVGDNRVVRDSGLRTSFGALKTITGPTSSVDAIVFLALSMFARITRRMSKVWDRDESSRVGRVTKS